MVKERASDLSILHEGERPAMREGKIRFLSDERFTPEDAEALLSATLGGGRGLQGPHGEGRRVRRPGRRADFRANLFVQRRRYGFVFRHVQERVPKIEDLHLPVAPLTRLSRLHRGIVLVTGIAGSGKSTTLSALVEHMNEHTDRHIVTRSRTRSSSSSATSAARSPSARSASTRRTTRRPSNTSSARRPT